MAEFDFVYKVVNENFRPHFDFPVKKSIKKLIEKCWSDIPDERPSFDEIYRKLANKEEDDDDDSDGYLMDDVDIDELNLYIEDLEEVTDGTEKLLQKIAAFEEENEKLKKQNKQLTLEKQQQLEKIAAIEEENEKLKKKNKKLTLEKQQQLETITAIEEENEELKKQNKEFINDSEKMIIQLRKELEQAKNEADQIKIEMSKTKDEKDERKGDLKLITHYITVGGYDYNNLLGVEPNNKASYSCPTICPPLHSSIDHSSILSFSVYEYHTVLVTRGGSLLGIGKNHDGRISASLPETDITQFTEFSIKDDSGCQLSAVSAVCYNYGTLYMLTKRDGKGKQLVLCDSRINSGSPVFLDIGDAEPVALFGGFLNVAAISDKGEIIHINCESVQKSPSSRIAAVSLPDDEKASSVACLQKSVVVLSSNGRVFRSHVKSNEALNFSIVPELSDQEIVCVSGTFRHCLAVK